MKVRVETVTADDITAGYVHFGTEGRQPLVILPGLSIKSVLGSAQAIGQAYGIFEKDYEVYLFDRRNEMPEKYEIRDMAEDTVKIMKALKLEKVELFGVSMGGMIAQVIAFEHPAMVRHLVLGSTTSRIDGSGQEMFDEWISYAEKKDGRGLSEAFGSLVYSPDFYEKYKDIIINSSADASEEDFRRFITCAQGTVGFDVYDRLTEIKCPVLVLAAGKDMVLGVQASKDIAERAHGKLYVYEEYGHAAYDEAPDYKERIYRFLAEKD